MTDNSKKVMTLAVEHGALTEVPIWQEHHRGKNWAATITGIDPAKPAALDREFWRYANGEYYYLLPENSPLVGGAMEFAADYSTASGRRERTRWYGVITAATEDKLTLVECKTGRAAFRAGQELLLAQVASGQSDTLDALFTETLERLNATLPEPGQRWYGIRAEPKTVARRSGKLGDWRFRLLTDRAAREAGLLPPES